MSDPESKGPGFSVSDRRAFSSQGEPRDEGTAAPAAATSAEPTAPESAARRPGRERPLPPVDFTTFILSLGSSALMHLGDVARSDQGAPGRDLPMAKHTIDLLSLLQDKTRGNLSVDEDKLLDGLLYDLRLRYVELCKTGG